MSTDTPNASQAPASEQYESWKKYPNTYSEPKHDDWQRENARLREELAAIHAAWPDGLDEIESSIQQFKQRAEQAEARALEYKTEHAALLGTSQWQETEIADLRDDVKRLMQTVSECEERALANEKDAERWKWARYNGVLKRGKPMDTYFIYNDEADQYADAAIGAKHD